MIKAFKTAFGKMWTICLPSTIKAFYWRFNFPSTKLFKKGPVIYERLRDTRTLETAFPSAREMALLQFNAQILFESLRNVWNGCGGYNLYNVNECNLTSPCATSQSLTMHWLMGSSRLGIISSSGLGINTPFQDSVSFLLQGSVSSFLQGLVSSFLQGLVSSLIQGLVSSLLQGLVSSFLQGLVSSLLQGLVISPLRARYHLSSRASTMHCTVDTYPSQQYNTLYSWYIANTTIHCTR